MSYSIGQVVGGRYEIQGVLAPQAVGELYRVQQTELNIPMLMLAIGPSLLPDEAAQQQFVQKVGLARGLRAPNLIRMFDVRTDGEMVVLAAQWVAADTLRDRLDRRRKEFPSEHGLPAQEAWAVLQPIAQAVQQLHREGEVLGDLRCETVFITVDGIRLFNHGVGMALPRDRFITAFERSGDINSVAPEIQDGRTVGTRADVYALSSMAWELFFGEPPPYVGSPHDESPIGGVLRRALDPEPRERPINIEAFLRDLEEAVKQPAPPPPEPEPPAKTTPTQAATATPADAPLESPTANPFGEVSTREINLSELEQLVGDQNQNTTRQINLAEIESLLAKSKDPHSPEGEKAAATEASTPASTTPATPTTPTTTTTPTTPAATPAPGSAPTPMTMTHAAAVAALPDAKDTPAFAPEVTNMGSPVILLTSADMKTGTMAPVDYQPGAGGPEVAGNQPPPMWEDVKNQLEPKKAPLVPIVIAVVVLAVAAFGAYKYATGGSTAPAPVPEPPAAAPNPSAPSPSPSPSPGNPGATPPAPGAPAAAAASDMAAPLSCPTGTTLVRGDKPVCIDQFEFPGEGFPPRASVSFVEALQLCNGKGARMCTAGEWERACRGPSGTAFPYGATFAPKVCNTKAPGSKVAVAGSFPECKSAVGAFDMSGNVAEWVLVEPQQVPAQKGGSAQSTQPDVRCDHTSPVSGLGGGPLVGFRCCHDAR